MTVSSLVIFFSLSSASLIFLITSSYVISVERPVAVNPSATPCAKERIPANKVPVSFLRIFLSVGFVRMLSVSIPIFGIAHRDAHDFLPRLSFNHFIGAVCMNLLP